MSNTDFHARLNRISANAQQPSGQTGRPKGRQALNKMRFGLFFVGTLIFFASLEVVKFVNTRYETIRDDFGIGVAAGTAFVAVLGMLAGVVMMYRAVPKGHSSPKDSQSSNVEPKRKASNKARVICSLFGFALGAIAIFYILLSAAASLIETEAARHLTTGGFVIAGGLLLVALIFGFVGLFLRGYALGRVPGYFVLGFILTYLVFRFARVNPMEWQQFTAALQ